MEFDDDINGMDLEYAEKSGLQLFRNYTKAFDQYAEKQFKASVDAEPFDLAPFRKVSTIISEEDVRFLPIVICAFADEVLINAFKTSISKHVPGNVRDLLGQFGPLSSLNHRIKIAYVATLVSTDVLESIDNVRRTRNRIAHDWSINEMQEIFRTDPIRRLPSIEGIIADLESKQRYADLPAASAFRVRLVWIVSRLVYEGPLFRRAVEARLNPHQALYGSNHPSRLSHVARVAMEATDKIADSKGR